MEGRRGVGMACFGGEASAVAVMHLPSEDDAHLVQLAGMPLGVVVTRSSRNRLSRQPERED